MRRPWTRGEKWLFATPLLFGVIAIGVAAGPRVVQRVTGYPTELPPTTGSHFKSMSLSRDGRFLVAGQGLDQPHTVTTNTIQLWDARTLQPLPPLQRPLSPKYVPLMRRTFYDGQTRTVALSPNGRTLAWHSSGGLTFTDLSTRRPLWLVKNYVEGIAFSPDNRLVAVVRTGNDKHNFLQIATTTTGKPVTGWEYGSWGGNDYEFSPQGHYFASTSARPPIQEWAKAPDKNGGGIEVRNAKNWKIERVLPLPNIRALSFSPDERRLVGIGPIFEESDSGSYSKTRLRCFDLSSGQVKWESDPSQSNADPRLRMIGDVCYSPDGKRIAVVANARTVLLLDADTGKVLRTLPRKAEKKNYSFTLADLAFSPDGQRIFAQDSESVLVWDLE